jgi:hypothetical protein
MAAAYTWVSGPRSRCATACSASTKTTHSCQDRTSALFPFQGILADRGQEAIEVPSRLSRALCCLNEKPRSVNAACSYEGVGAELAIHGGDLRDRWTVAVGHDRRS